MSDWFHCNKCYLEITSAQGAKFLLTNCGHIFCEKCINTGKPNYCHMCRNECTTIALSSNLNPDIQIFFTDLSDSLQKLIKVQEFQKNHYKKLSDYKSHQIQVLETKYIHAKEYIKKLSKNYESIQKDNQRLKHLLQMSISSPNPGSHSRGNLNDSSLVNTPQASIPNSGHNSSRSIVRGQPGFNSVAMKSGMGKRESNQQNFRTPVYHQTPSIVSVASSSGSRASMVQGRSSGVPSSFPRQSPGINLSRLNFGR